MLRSSQARINGDSANGEMLADDDDEDETRSTESSGKYNLDNDFNRECIQPSNDVGGFYEFDDDLATASVSFSQPRHSDQVISKSCAK